MHLSKKLPTCLLLGTTLVATGAPAFAQEDGGLQEIIVTAQKREQSLQDVPVAITAISADSIRSNRITSVQDLSGLAPNVIVRPAAGGSAIPTFSMRGLTSYGVVPGSDKQVSINLDGVYISASRGALFELPDIARIEMLRGPQGTLFGRNATAGAVSIVSKDPDGQLGGRLELGIGNYDQRRIRASVDLPQIGPFSGYVSFVHNERRGDIRNLGAGTRWDRTGVGTYLGKTYSTGLGVDYSPEYLGSRNVETYFGAFKFAPIDSFRIIYKFDMSIDNSTPEGVGVTGLNTAQPSATAGGLILGAIYANQPANAPYGAVVLAPDGLRPKAVNNFYTVPSYLKNSGHNVTISSELTDNLSFKSITAYRKSYLRQASSQIGGLGGLVVTDAAIASAPGLFISGYAALTPAQQAGALLATQNALRGQRLVDVGTQIQNVSRQWSQEFQLNYDSDSVTLTAGGIYFRSQDRSGVPAFTRGTLQLTFIPATGEMPLGTTGVSHNKAISYAGFAQAEVHVTPQIDIVLGGRLTRDKKSGYFLKGTSLTGAPTGSYTSNVPGCPVTSNPVGVCRTSGVYNGFTAPAFAYSDTRPIYSVGINFKPDRDILGFIKYSTGYVSGGSIGGVAFKAETVRSLEAGVKADLLDRKLRTNLALFHASYKNVQSSQSGRNVGRPDLGTLIISGFDEKTYGFEFEATAAPTEGLTLGASLGYTHIKQSNFAPLYLTTITVAGQAPRPVRPVPTGTPKWTSNLSAQYQTQPLFGDVRLMARIDANLRSRMRNDSNGDKETLIPVFANVVSTPAQWLLNGRVALQDFQIGAVTTELALWSRNLLNDRKVQYPLILPFGTGASYQAARTFGLDLIVKY